MPSTKLPNFLIIALVITALSACRAQIFAPQRDCDIQLLLLDKNYFNLPKEGISDYYFDSPVSEAPPESAGYSFYYQKDSLGDLVGNEIFRYRFIEQAKDMYRARDRYMSRTDVFQISEDFENWKMPNGSLLRPQADEYQAACGTMLFEKRCEFIARYQEYYVSFQIGLSTGSLRMEDFVDGVNQIDKQMMACLAN